MQNSILLRVMVMAAGRWTEVGGGSISGEGLFRFSRSQNLIEKGGTGVGILE